MLTSCGPQELELVELSFYEIRDLAESGKHYAVMAIITPQVAQAILDKCNGRNRPVRNRQIKFLTAQIESGRFVYNGESIVFATDRHLNNGQHRLMACASSGKPISVLLVFGVPPEHFSTYDQQAVRGQADVLAIDDRKNCKTLAAALRHVSCYENGTLGSFSGKNGREDNSQVLDLLAKHPGLQESVDKFVKFWMASPSLVSAIHYLLRRVDSDAADAFLDVVEHGYESPHRGSRDIFQAANNLREWLLRNAAGKRRASNTVTGNVFIKAWNGYRTGTVPKVLSFRDNEKQVEII